METAQQIHDRLGINRPGECKYRLSADTVAAVIAEETERPGVTLCPHGMPNRCVGKPVRCPLCEAASTLKPSGRKIYTQAADGRQRINAPVISDDGDEEHAGP